MTITDTSFTGNNILRDGVIVQSVNPGARVVAEALTFTENGEGRVSVGTLNTCNPRTASF